jgi:hypothetical protein
LSVASVTTESAPSAEVTTTSATEPSTTTTLSDREQRVHEIEAAEAEIEQVVEAWWTYPYDSSAGASGLPLEYTVNPLHDRYLADAAEDTAAGQIRRARGGNRVRIIETDLAFDDGEAEVRLCISGDWEVVDAETGAELQGSDGVPGEAVVYAESVDGEWKINEFFFSRAVGNNIDCEL